MAYPKEIKDIIKLIPKEHHKYIGEIIKFYYELGVKDTQRLISEIVDVPPTEIREFGIHHQDELDGG